MKGTVVDWDGCSHKFEVAVKPSTSKDQFRRAWENLCEPLYVKAEASVGSLQISKLLLNFEKLLGEYPTPFSAQVGKLSDKVESILGHLSFAMSPAQKAKWNLLRAKRAQLVPLPSPTPPANFDFDIRDAAGVLKIAFWGNSGLRKGFCGAEDEPDPVDSEEVAVASKGRARDAESPSEDKDAEEDRNDEVARRCRASKTGRCPAKRTSHVQEVYLGQGYDYRALRLLGPDLQMENYVPLWK